MTVSRSRHRSALLAICCFSVPLLSGCWDRAEVNDLALISAAALDRNEDSSLELSVQVFIPRGGGGQDISGGGGGGGGGSQGQTFVRSANGLTISDAMMKLQEKLPRRIFWGHNEVFIFGSELAREGVQEHIDFMIRYPQVRESTYLFVSQGRAKKMIELIPSLERSSSEVLRELAASRIGVKATLKDLVQRMQGDSQAVALPWIEVLPPPPNQDQNRTIPYLRGSAILKKGKLIGQIDDELTRGVLWLRNEIVQAMITVSPEDTKGYVSMKLLRARTRLIPTIERGNWVITLKADTEDDIVQNGTDMNFMNPKYTRELEKELEDQIRTRVEQTLNLVQTKMKADVFGFAYAFHRKYPKAWKRASDRWDTLFPEVEVRYRIHAHVRRPGMSSNPAGVPEKQVRK